MHNQLTTKSLSPLFITTANNQGTKTRLFDNHNDDESQRRPSIASY